MLHIYRQGSHAPHIWISQRGISNIHLVLCSLNPRKQIWKWKWFCLENGFHKSLLLVVIIYPFEVMSLSLDVNIPLQINGGDLFKLFYHKCIGLIVVCTTIFILFNLNKHPTPISLNWFPSFAFFLWGLWDNMFQGFKKYFSKDIS